MEEKRYLKRKEKAFMEGNRDQLAICCNHLGDYYNQMGIYDNAVKEYQQEADIYSKLDKKLEMAKAHRMVGEMYMLLSDFDKAKEHVHIYLKIVKKLMNKVEQQRAYATLGRLHLLHGQSLIDISQKKLLEEMNAAHSHFLKSLKLIKELTGQISKLEQLDMQARCYLNLGVVKEHTEEFEESINYIESAIKICKSNDIFELTHLCYISMSLLYHCKKNDSKLALRYCNLALEVAKRLPNKVKKICETLITKSEILIKEGDFASAKQILTKAYKKNTPDENDRNTIEKSLRIVVKICQILDELVTTSSIDYAKRKTLYESLGDGCCHLLNYSKAIEYYHQMLECAQKNGEKDKDLIPIYVSLYQTYKDNTQFDKALEYLWMEFELNKNEPTEAFSSLCSIAEICEMQSQPFWTIHNIYEKAKIKAALAGDVKEKLERIVYARIKKLLIKHKMIVMTEELVKEAAEKGIDLNKIDDDEDDNESETNNIDNETNTPVLGDDICLDDLTDSDTSDLDETEKPRPHRTTRGTRGITIKRNNKGETQLHQACIAGNIELVRRLIDQGHVVNVRDHAGWLPLHEACNHGFRDIVEILLTRGSAVAINDKGGTSCDGISPIYDACSNGFLDVVELLLEHGADATLKTDYGETCIDGLDRWRKSATLTDGEQAHYEQVRSTILKTLSKVGLCKAQNKLPLTNDNVESEGSLDEYDRYDDIDTNSEFDIENIQYNNSEKIRKDIKKKSQRTPTASIEYKTVMEQLKRRNRIPVSSPIIESNISQKLSNQKRSALLESQEIDPDSWLIDDIGPEKKKRRFHTASLEGRTASTSKKSLNDSGILSWNIENLSSPIDTFQIMADASKTSTQQHKTKSKLSLSRTSSMSSNSSRTDNISRSKSKQQSSLLDSGFCRFRSESPIMSEDSNDNNCSAEPDSTTQSIHLVISPVKSSPIKVQTTQLLSTTVSFKIKVENELLLVPIERRKLNDINIRWLADEAARRYNNLVGLKPVLRLKTADGFAYEENDAVSVALEQNMIVASVLEWQISPLPQRYEEICRQTNKDLNMDIQKNLERAQVSNILNLENLWLPPNLTEPLFKALLHQTNLHILDLSNNFIQNDGCRQLAKSLSTLKHLKSINLKGNFITTDGVETLFTNENIEKLDALESLNLSHNPLGNESLRYLAKFCNGPASKTLKEFKLSQCQLTNLYDYDLCYYQLHTFDISYNHLKCESWIKLLTKLNSSRLQYLNISYANQEYNSDIDNIAEFFEGGTCEKFKTIKLCGCKLNDSTLYRMIQCLRKSNEFELLDISDNNQLSALTFQIIIEKLPQLRQLKAINCNQLIDAERLEKLTLAKSIPKLMSLTLDNTDANIDNLQRDLNTLWLSHYGHDQARIHSYNGNIFCYINDKDFNSF